jgi:hypothetical protein
MTEQKFYNKKTKTLKILPNFNKKITKIPEETQKIIFLEDEEYYNFSTFNKSINNLPKNITYIKFGNLLVTH